MLLKAKNEAFLRSNTTSQKHPYLTCSFHNQKVRNETKNNTNIFPHHIPWVLQQKSDPIEREMARNVKEREKLNVILAPCNENLS